jgi:hypothetical protein
VHFLLSHNLCRSRRPDRSTSVTFVPKKARCDRRRCALDEKESRSRQKLPQFWEAKVHQLGIARKVVNRQKNQSNHSLKMTVADTMTNSIRDMSVMADEKIAPVVLALNRQIFFTDVPCGAMKIRDCDSTELRDDDDLPKGLARFCGSLERVFCFTDLRDIAETDLKSLRSMHSIGDNGVFQKGTPVVETVDRSRAVTTTR